MKPKGLRKAIALLKKLSREFNIDVKSLRDPSRLDHFVKVRREFCIRGRAMGISNVALGKAICRDHSVVSYHSRPLAGIIKRGKLIQYRARKKFEAESRVNP